MLVLLQTRLLKVDCLGVRSDLRLRQTLSSSAAIVVEDCCGIFPAAAGMSLSGVAALEEPTSRPHGAAWSTGR